MISKNDEYVKMVLKVFKALTQHILHKIFFFCKDHLLSMTTAK